MSFAARQHDFGIGIVVVVVVFAPFRGLLERATRDQIMPPPLVQGPPKGSSYLPK